MRCGRTFRLARTHPVRARSSGSETLSRSRSLADYTIDMHESEFSEATGPGARRKQQYEAACHCTSVFLLCHSCSCDLVMRRSALSVEPCGCPLKGLGR